MKVQAAIEEIKFKLGRRRDLDDIIRARLDAVQLKLEQSDALPWFLRDLRQIEVNAANIEVPTGFLREHEDGGLFLVGDFDYPEVNKVTMERLRLSFRDATGVPCVYSLAGTRVYFAPIPDKTYTVEWDAYWAAVLPSAALAAAGSNATNLWLTYAPAVLINKVAAEISMDLRDADGAQVHATAYQDAWIQLQRDSSAKREQNQLRTMGEDN